MLPRRWRALAAGQRRILALLEALVPEPGAAAGDAGAAAGDAGAALGEAARSIAAATEWTNDIHAAMDALLVTAGKSIRDLEKSEQGLAGQAAALKTREEAFDRQIETLSGGARTLGARLGELDEARQKLDARSAELQDGEAGHRRILRAMDGGGAGLPPGDDGADRPPHGGREPRIGGWRRRSAPGRWRSSTASTGTAEAQRQAAARTSGAVQRLTESGDAFLETFGAAWQGAVEDFRKEWRRTRRWSVPVLAAVLALMVPALPVMGALGQSELGVFSAYDDTKGW